MNIPGVVRIGSCYYDVEFTNDTLTVDGRDVMGVIEYYIAKGLHQVIFDNPRMFITEKEIEFEGEGEEE